MTDPIRLGIIRPNLVVHLDNEKGYQFQVQCEVQVVDKQAGLAIADLIASADADKLKEAREIVWPFIDRDATTNFREIILKAFDENVKYLEEGK